MRDLLQLHDVLSVEQRRSLLESPVLGLDDEEVQEGGLEREPAAVHDLIQTRGQHPNRDRNRRLLREAGARCLRSTSSQWP